MSCKNFDNTVADFNNGNVECTAAEVVYHDLLFTFIIKAVSQSGWLVDDTFNIKTCNLTGILGCLSLSIVEVCRNCNNRFCDFFTQIAFCICF